MPLRDKHLSILWTLFPALLAVSFWFGVKAGGDNLLKNDIARWGMGSLERAGSKEQAQRIIQSWNEPAPDRERRLTDVAKRSLVFDLFFIVFYASALAVACLLAATEIAMRRRRQEESRLVSAGIRLAYAQIITAAFDLLGNVALWRMLSNSTNFWRIWPWVAYGCSLAKWFLVAISLTYVLIAFIFWVADHKPPKRTRRQRTATGTT